MAGAVVVAVPQGDAGLPNAEGAPKAGADPGAEGVPKAGVDPRADGAPNADPEGFAKELKGELLLAAPPKAEAPKAGALDVAVAPKAEVVAGVAEACAPAEMRPG